MATTTSRSERRFAASARRDFVAAALLGLVALGACREREPTPVEPALRPPALPPAGLVFKGEIGQPEVFHRSLGGLVAPAIVGKLSGRWEATFAVLSDLPRSVMERLDPAGPLQLLGLESSAGLVPVFAARVPSGEEIVALLTQGSNAPRRAVRRDDGVALLPPVEGATGAALAVVDGFVLVSPDARALERSADYAVRGFLPGRVHVPDLRLTLPKSALSGAVRAWIATRWSTLRSELERSAAELARERGRAADFAEPSAVLALLDGVVQGLSEVLASSSSLSLRLTPFDDRLELVLELEPESGAALELSNRLRPASLEPLARLPADSAVALSFRPTPAAPSEAARPGALRALFGARLAGRDAERVEAFLAQAAREPPDARAFALLRDRTFVYREDRLEGAPGTDLAGAVALLELSAFEQPFRALFGQPVLARNEGSLDATLALGPSARTAVDRAAGRAPKDTGLGLDPALRARHEPAALALHVELSRLGLGTASAPLLLSLTRRSRAISLRLELSRGASHVLLERILRR